MIQQKQSNKIPYHFIHIQNILKSILSESATKMGTIIFTKRTYQIVYSILSESQIFQCGYKKILSTANINSYMQFQDITLVFTLSGQQDFDEISQFSRNMHKVYILHFGTCTQESKKLLKQLQFKQNNSIKAFKQQNLDFFCYLHNAYILSTRKQHKSKSSKNNKKMNKSSSAISQQVAIDRLCSFLFSYQIFSQFQFYIPKNSGQLGKKIKQKMQDKLAILAKYKYAGLAKGQGMMSSIKTRVIVLERVQQISPYILSLLYGPLTQQLNLGNTCRFVSIHSCIYKQLYCLDLLKASEKLTKMAQDFSSGRDHQLNSVSLSQAKKQLQKAYNPNMSRQELQFHQKLLKQINQFMKSNVELLALQQSIGNKINEEGQKMSGSMIVKAIQDWCLDQNNENKYENYLGLIMEAFTVHSFWWYQNNSLMAAITDNEDIEAVNNFKKKCKQKYKIHNLKQKQCKKDQDGAQIRQKCFRHQPSMISQLAKIKQQIKTNKLLTCDLLKVNPPQIQSTGKKTRTVVYINDIIGYNQLAMLLSSSNQDIDFVCKDIKNTREWSEYQLGNI